LVTVEPLRLGRRRKRAKKKEYRAQAKQYLEFGREFRALGKVLSIHGETFHEKLNGAIAVGLAEVCELLAEVAEQEGV